MLSERRRHARALFAPLGPTYDRVGAVLSFGQDPRWRRFLVDRLPRDGGHVLDVATGTGLVAQALLGRGFRVTGLDQSTEMLDRARERFGDRVVLVEGSADELPFADASFDHLTFTYLLRYVDDPAATLVELARVVRPGGTIAMLEFGVPRGIWRPAWNVWVGVGLPVAGRLISPGWHEVGRFLGPSISSFHETYPEPVLLALWRAAGVEDVRRRHLSLGGGVVLWGVRGDAE
ncbi:MAG TPA: class I SAM-dependent methyltransferase [Gaiella sp.]|jgi:demethylmenaquinone methyltransferase/2-methoxy-6-polyprenyl-1,4-benzoquinol methylase